MSSFWECLTQLRTGLSVRLISRMRSIRCASPDDYLFFLHCPLFLASEVGENAHSWIIPVRTELPMGFSWAMLSCKDVTDHCTLSGSAGSPLFGLS